MSKQFEGSIVAISSVYGVAELLGRLIQAAALFIIAGMLEKADFGRYGLLLAVQQIVMVLCIGGLIEAIAGEYSNAVKTKSVPELRIKAWGAFLASTIVVILLIFAILVALSIIKNRLIASFSIVEIFLAVCTGFVISIIQIETNFLRLGEDHAGVIKVRFLAQALGNGAGLLLAYIYGTISAIFTGILVGTVLALWVGKLRTESQSWSLSALDYSKNLILSGFPYLVVGLVAWISGYGANVFIFSYFGARVGADFTFVFSFLTLLLLVANSFNQAWMPRFLSLLGNLDLVDIEKQNEKISRLLFLFMALATIAMLGLFPWIIRYLGGGLNEYIGVQHYLAIGAFGFLMQIPYYKLIGYLIANRGGKIQLKISLVVTLVGIPVWAGLAYLLGPVGIFIGWALLSISRSIFTAVVVARRWGGKPNILFYTTLSSVVIALAYCIGAYSEQYAARFFS